MEVSSPSLMQLACHNEDVPYICPKCNSTFNGSLELSLHNKEFCCTELEKNSNCIIYTGTKTFGVQQKKLSLCVDDYFYGEVEGSHKVEIRYFKQKLSCYLCGKFLRNNLRLMSHVRHKIENKWKENNYSCNICYRHHATSFDLESHMETVHSDVPAATTCRICEINFAHGKLFLAHMEKRHSYNEMPYVCKVCSYRSSFFSDLANHFRQKHENSISLMCPFCLSIHNTAKVFVDHVIQHLKSSIWCPRCRLQFLKEKDKLLHLKLDHQSVDNVPSKKVFPKNPYDFTIHVEMRPHSLPSPKNGLSSSFSSPSSSPPTSLPPRRSALPFPLPSSATSPSSSAVCTSKTNQSWVHDFVCDGDIPMEDKPLVRTTNIFIVLEYGSIKKKAIKCLECGEKFGIYIADYNKHFRNEYRCCKCLYRSHCYKAVKRHILRTHVNRPQQANLWNGAPPSAVNAQASFTNETGKEAQSSRNFGGLTLVKSAKEISDGQIISSGSGGIDRKEETKTSEKKSILGKRKIMSINDLLFAKVEKENKQRDESKSDVAMLKSTKKRRKQLKPQKVPLNEMESDSTTPFGTPTSPLLKPLSEVVNEEVHADDSVLLANPTLCADVKTDADSNKTLKTAKTCWTSEKVTLRSNCAGNNASLVRNRLIENFANQSGFDAKRNTPSPKVTSRRRGPKKSFVPMALPKEMDHSVQAKKTAPKQIKTSTPSSKPAKPTKAVVQQQPSQAQAATTAVVAAIKRPPSKDHVSIKRPPDSFEVVKPPRNLKFGDVTKSSFYVSWEPPLDCSVSRYKLSFQGAGVPTTQELSSAQTFVRLIGLRSNTHYLVRLCAVHKSFHSPYIAATQRTLHLREKKEITPVKVNDVITLDDDEDDVPEASQPTYSVTSTPTDQTSDKNVSSTPSVDLALKDVTEGSQLPQEKDRVTLKDSSLAATSSETVVEAEEQLASASDDDAASSTSSDNKSDSLLEFMENLPTPAAETLTTLSSEPNSTAIAAPLESNQEITTKNALEVEGKVDKTENYHTEKQNKVVSTLSTNVLEESKELAMKNSSVDSVKDVLKADEAAKIAKSDCKVIIKRLDPNCLTKIDDSVVIKDASLVSDTKGSSVKLPSHDLEPNRKATLNEIDEGQFTVESLDDILAHLTDSG